MANGVPKNGRLRLGRLSGCLANPTFNRMYSFLAFPPQQRSGGEPSAVRAITGRRVVPPLGEAQPGRLPPRTSDES